MLLNYSQNHSYILDTRTATHYAFTEWQTCLNITFSETTIVEDADIKISFIPIDGPGNVLAQAYYPNSKGMGIVHLDSGEDWYYDFLFNVILHELGHTFGVGHSSVKEAVMYNFYYGDSKKLQADDCNAIESLYGLKNKWGPINPTPVKPTTTETPVKPTTTTKKMRPSKRINSKRFNSTYNHNYKIYHNGKIINIYNSRVDIFTST